MKKLLRKMLAIGFLSTAAATGIAASPPAAEARCWDCVSNQCQQVLIGGYTDGCWFFGSVCAGGVGASCDGFTAADLE